MMLISPLDSRLRCWKIFMAVLAAYSSWTYPYEAAFQTNSARTKTLKHIYTADSIVNFFFLLDLTLTFFVAYFNPRTQRLVRDPKKIAIRYLKSWFIVDMASILPLELVSYFFNGRYRYSIIYSVLGWIRLSRLRHVKRLFYRLEWDIGSSYFWVRCPRVLCVILFAIHFHSLKLWNPYEDVRLRISRNAAEQVFLVIYRGFFKLWLPSYALSNMIALIYMLFDSRTGIKRRNQAKTPLMDILHKIDAMHRIHRFFVPRVSIYKGLPTENNTYLAGAVIELPSSLMELKRIAGDIYEFDASNAIVVSEEGDQLSCIEVIRDNEKIFIGNFR